MAEERRKRLEKRRAEPRHTFDDHTYMQQIKDTEENMDSALRQGESLCHARFQSACMRRQRH